VFNRKPLLYFHLKEKTMTETLSNLWPAISNTLIPILWVLLILFVTWLVARIVSGIVRSLLNKSDLDNRLSSFLGGGSDFPVENIISRVVFWLIILGGLTILLDYVKLPAAAAPLNSMLQTITTFLPKLFAAAVVGLIGLVLARLVQAGVTRAAEGLNIDSFVNRWDDSSNTAGHTPAESDNSIGNALGTVLFWLIMLIFLMLVLDILGLRSLVTPLQEMFNSMLGFLPNILSAGLILGIGIIVARVIKKVISGLLGAVGVDNFGNRAGLNLSLTEVVGTLAYTVVMLLTITQALQALKISAISDPATRMIDQIFGAVPGLVGAGLILAIALIVGRLVSGLVANLLAGAGADTIPSRLGLKLNTGRTLSDLVGSVILIAFMLMAALAATDMLGFQQLTEIVQGFVKFGGQILIGLITLGIGLFIANLAADVARNAGMSGMVVTLVRSAVLILVGAMALQAIGIGQTIVELAFGIALGAVGIAAALAFGLGGRETAGRELERFINNQRSDSEL
jgi:hypothetical protein